MYDELSKHVVACHADACANEPGAEQERSPSKRKHCTVHLPSSYQRKTAAKKMSPLAYLPIRVPRHATTDITVTLEPLPCAGASSDNDNDSAASCAGHHPNITCYLATILTIPPADPSLADLAPTRPAGRPIGHVKLYVLDKALTTHLFPSNLWDECRAYDAAHLGAKLAKVENFLANESFPAAEQTRVDEAETVVVVDEVVLGLDFRGQDLGLTALRLAVGALGLFCGGEKMAVAMLQVGSVGEDTPGSSGDSESDSGEKLTRHWGRLGFRAWSVSDPAWLLVGLEAGGFVADGADRKAEERL